ncbi:MAG: alpha/beta hydrolase family protein [Candidatus Muiribacteriaceae bacterium]
MRKTIIIFAFLLFAVSIAFSMNYQLPDQEIVKMVRQNPEPYYSLKVNTGNYVEVYYNALPELEDIARPIKKLGGVRIDPNNFSEHTKTFYTKFRFFTPERQELYIKGLPDEIKCSDYEWSESGRYFAFINSLPETNDLWVVDMNTNVCSKVTTNLSNVFTNGVYWIPGDDEHVIVTYAANKTRKEPEKDVEFIKPVIQESMGKESKVRTYQDLLQNPYDEKLFDHYFSSMIAKVNIRTGRKEFIGKPGVYYVGGVSPDGRFLLATEYKKPYSYVVPFYYFARDTAVFDLSTGKKIVVEEQPVSDQVPIGGVYTGKRYFHWVPYQDATLFHLEALDGGDPENEVPHRDKVCLLEYPFKNSKEIYRLKGRYSSMAWLENAPMKGIIADYDWKRRWITKRVVDFSRKDPEISIFEDRSIKDDYNSMGDYVEYIDKMGNEVIFYRDDKIYTKSKGATKDGYFPVLYEVNMNTLEKKELFRCPEGRYDRFIAFTDTSLKKGLVKGESSEDYPNYYELDISTGDLSKISDFRNPFPFLKEVDKEIVKYMRADGVELSGTLYYPVGFSKGDKVPVVLHAYPLEYSDKSTAGQVRSSSNTFTKISYMSELFFLLQGVAVFKNAQFPVVGDPKTMNDEFIPQLKLNAEAARDALKATGDIDTDRMACIGHSYGAFMVANLLIHTDLFRTGIAQSGAYNRTLTPFGFQSERRTFWEAPDTYFEVSPFMHADKLDEPILMIHGEIDSNPGTYPIQSDRLFAAIKGNGGSVRYVKFPYEDHGYRAEESILHLLWERYEWVEKYLK